MTVAASWIKALLAVLVIATALEPIDALADPPDISGHGASDAYEIVGQQATGGSGSVDDASTAAQSDGSGSSGPVYIDYQWMSVCVNNVLPSTSTTALECGAARTCADPVDRLWRLWGRTRAGSWNPLGSQCYGATNPPTVVNAPQPTVTPAMVLNALRRMGLPSLRAESQPEEKTLVNFATIFYTEPEQFTETITLLGQSVDVEATPSEYTWHHGDGTSLTTSSPGAPYPSKEITHEFLDAEVTVGHSVDVAYSARFRVGGGDWQSIAETVTIEGPPTALRVSEATALLSGEYQ